MTGNGLPSGVWAVVPTPFAGNAQAVDESSLDRLAGHYEALGVAGLVVLGVFGEATRLDTEERRAVLEVTVDAAALPLVVGVTALATAPAIEEASLAAEVVGDRLAGLMVQVNTPSSPQLADHLNAIHEATGAGIVIQDYPLASGVTISADALAEAARSVSAAVAIKAEANPAPLAVALLTERLEIPVFGGLGGVGLIDELAAGAAGAMTGFSATEGLQACCTGWTQGGYAAAKEAYAPYLPLANFEAQAGIGLALRKEALRRRGLIGESSVRPPARPMPHQLSAQLSRHLSALGQVADGNT